MIKFTTQVSKLPTKKLLTGPIGSANQGGMARLRVQPLAAAAHRQHFDESWHWDRHRVFHREGSEYRKKGELNDSSVVM